MRKAMLGGRLSDVRPEAQVSLIDVGRTFIELAGAAVPSSISLEADFGFLLGHFCWWLKKLVPK